MQDEEKVALKFLSYLLPSTFILLGFPLALNLIGPNGIYGIRSAKALESLENWYSVNFVGGVSFVVAGLLSIMIVILLHTRFSSRPVFNLVMSFLSSITLMIVAIIVVFWLG